MLRQTPEKFALLDRKWIPAISHPTVQAALSQLADQTADAFIAERKADQKATLTKQTVAVQHGLPKNEPYDSLLSMLAQQNQKTARSLKQLTKDIESVQLPAIERKIRSYYRALSGAERGQFLALNPTLKNLLEAGKGIRKAPEKDHGIGR